MIWNLSAFFFFQIFFFHFFSPGEFVEFVNFIKALSSKLWLQRPEVIRYVQAFYIYPQENHLLYPIKFDSHGTIGSSFVNWRRLFQVSILQLSVSTDLQSSVKYPSSSICFKYQSFKDREVSVLKGSKIQQLVKVIHQNKGRISKEYLISTQKQYQTFH